MGNIERGGLLGGIGLFLFGMTLFEHTIQENGKGWLKHTLKKYTNSLPKSIITGMLQTFVFQSSTIVTMITLGFVGAGLIGLYNALGVVLGANIGSSLTTWLVALVGFNFKIETYILPIIGLAGLTMVITSESNFWHKLSKTIVGFSLLFLGLGYMKESVESMTSAINFASYANWSVRGFIAIGAILTTIIQTSTGVTIMTLVALSGGIITLDMGLGVIIGANIGSALSTGIIGFLSSTKGQHTKKQVAVSQIIFNCTTALIMIPLIQPLKHLILDFTTNNETALAVFHTTFNLVLVLLWPPLLKSYSVSLQKRFVGSQSKTPTLAVQTANNKFTEEVIAALYQDTGDFLSIVKQYCTLVFTNTGPQQSAKTIDLYSQIKTNQATILGIITRTKGDIGEIEFIDELNRITAILVDGVALSSLAKRTLDHCTTIIDESGKQGRTFYNSWKNLIHNTIKQTDDIPHGVDSIAREEYTHIIKHKIQSHRNDFISLVEVYSTTNPDAQLLAEILRTDHYITGLCEDVVDITITYDTLLATNFLNKKE